MARDRTPPLCGSVRPPEGSGSFLAGQETIEASGGSVVVVPAGEIHGFTASPGGPLRMTCLHLHDRMITEWVQPADR
jgi:quercetin dioxygenase-like cupin family protein